MAAFYRILGEMGDAATDKLNLSDFLGTVPAKNLHWAVFEYDGVGPGPKDTHISEYRAQIIKTKKPDYLSLHDLTLASSLMKDIDWFLGVGYYGEKLLPEKIGITPDFFVQEWFDDSSALNQIEPFELVVEIFDSTTWAIATKLYGHKEIVEQKLGKYITKIYDYPTAPFLKCPTPPGF